MSIKNWSTTAASNNSAAPNGAPEGWALSDINNTMRQVMADVRTLAASNTIASAATCDLGSLDETFLTVSGTTTITALGTVSAGIYKFVTFSGALTLTHNGTSLILPGAANITTAAGDTAFFESLGSGNWKCHAYQVASLAPGHATTATSSTSATTSTTATNIAGGASGSLPYQSGAATTAMLAKGTNGQLLTLAAGVPAWATLNIITSLTETATTSGPSVDITGIPSNAKRVTIMLNGVSTNGTSQVMIQVGAGSPTTTGYVGASSYLAATVTTTTFSSGFLVSTGSTSAANARTGAITLSLIGSNTWIATGTFNSEGVADSSTLAGKIALAGALDRVRITTVGGTDTFDAGSINVLYE